MTDPNPFPAKPALADLYPSLSDNLVSFTRILRRNGLKIGPDEARDALHAMTCIDLHRLKDLKAALSISMAKNLEAQTIFNDLFDAFWVDLITKNLKEPEQQEAKKNQSKNVSSRAREGLASIKEWSPGRKKTTREHTIAYSPEEVLTRKDFAGIQLEDVDEMAQLIEKLIRPLAIQQSRRFIATHHARHLDFRRTLRANLRRGGDLLELHHRRRRKERLDLVLVCDVSQSMEIYSRFLIGFAYALQRVYRKVDTFVFSTRLWSISEALQAQSVQQVLDAVAGEVEDWGSGTRIGESLSTLVHNHKRKIHRKSIVLILSDGWDTGDEQLLGRAMKAIKKNSTFCHLAKSFDGLSRL